MSLELTIILIVISIIFIITLIGFVFIFLYLKKNNKNPNQKQANENKEYDKKINEVDKLKHNLQSKIKEYDQAKNEYIQKINNIDKLDKQALTEEFYKVLKQNKINEINDYIEETNKVANLKAADILVSSMESMVEPLIQEHTTTSITIDDEQIKGRIIGRDGRNKRAFEIITGTDLIVEKDSNFITISSHNPIRREIARNLLVELIKTKSIEPTKIENLYKEIKQEFETKLFDIGKDVVENTLKILDLNQEVYPYIGRLKFRSSLGQNALNHIIECSCIASNIAEQLNLDPNFAKKSALLHDIGKSIDYEFNNNHIDAGVEIAKKLNLGDDIINAIQSHHGQTRCSNIYSEITKIADTISAARPGARVNSYNEYFTRVQEIENTLKDLKEINNVFVVKAGRTIRIMVNPWLVQDNVGMLELKEEIIRRIENNPIIKGYNLKVIMIKENRLEFETKAIH